MPQIIFDSTSNFFKCLTRRSSHLFTLKIRTTIFYSVCIVEGFVSCTKSVKYVLLSLFVFMLSNYMFFFQLSTVELCIPDHYSLKTEISYTSIENQIEFDLFLFLSHTSPIIYFQRHILSNRLS